MVAAWMSAETGVGPSIASGSQVNSGICALFPVAPRNSSSVAATITVPPATNTCGATANRRSYWRLPPQRNSVSMPRMKPKSPIRFTTNAFMPARAAETRSYQKPMSRYEHRPTPSQPTNISRKLSASTSVNIENMNRFR